MLKKILEWWNRPEPPTPIDRNKLSPAYQAGWQAEMDGDSRAENPYPDATLAHLQWDMGYDASAKNQMSIW